MRKEKVEEFIKRCGYTPSKVAAMAQEKGIDETMKHLLSERFWDALDEVILKPAGATEITKENRRQITRAAYDFEWDLREYIGER